MARTLTTCRRLYGDRSCAFCGEPFTRTYAKQECCKKGCATSLRFARIRRDPAAWHLMRLKCRERGLISARVRRRQSLDKLAKRLGRPTTARDLAVFRLGW